MEKYFVLRLFIITVLSLVWRQGYSANETLSELNLSVQQIVDEGAGRATGTVSVASAVASNLTVNLVSDNLGEVSHGSVIIPAGSHSASFDLSVVDDRLIDGVQTATISAQASGYMVAKAGIFVQDNEAKALFLSLPDDVVVGNDALTNAGSVYLDGIAVTDLHILLQSSDATEFSVPASVIINAGQSNAVFSISIMDGSETTGRQSSTITASFPGYVQVSEVLEIVENEVDSFAISGLEGDMPGNVPLLVTVEAVTIEGHVVAGYSGTVDLSARSASSASLQIEPTGHVELMNGRWQGAVTIRQSEDTNVQLEVSDSKGHTAISAAFDLFELRVKKMVTDWSLPYVYIMHREPDPSFPDYYNGPAARFIWFNTEFDAVEHVVDPGDNALDIAVHYGENRIYLSRQSEAVAYDRTSKEVLDPLPVTSSANQVTAGRAGRLLSVRDRYADLWDTETGEKLADAYLSRRGGGKCSPDSRYYFYAQDGSTGTKLTKYNMTGDTFLTEVSVDTRNFGSDNLVMAGDGTLAFNVGSVFQTSDLEEIAFHGYDKEVYSASFHGDVAVTETDVIDSLSGEVLLSLPIQRSEQSAFYPDQSKLLVFDPYSGKLETVPLDSIAGGEAVPGLVPVPMVGSLCMTSLSEISWTPVPYAISYEIYMGTDSNAVAMADTNSVEYLGRSSFPEHQLQEDMLSGSATYYWRVDVVEFGDTGKKSPVVWNFRTASILIDQSDLFAEGIAAAYATNVSVPIDSTINDPAAWSVSCSNDWIKLDSTNGMAPGSFDFTVDFAALTAGDHAAELVFNDGSGTFSIPFTVAVEKLRAIKMATDYELPYIYMLHTSGTSPNKSTLFWYNTDSGKIDRLLDAGENGTDLTVHYADNRIYVANGGRDETRVFSRVSKQELEPLLLGNDAYKVNAGRMGRLITEGYAQYGGSVNAHVFSTSNGTSQVSTSFSGGDGECSPDGRFYYHCQSKLITKYDLGQDDFTSVASKTISGRWDMIVCRDGKRVCDNRVVYDANLNELMTLNDTIHAASAYGELFITQTGACNGGNGEEIYELPFATRIMAFSGDQSQLMLFNEASGSLTSLVTSAIMPLPEPALDPMPSIGSPQGSNLPGLSWSGSPSAIGYDVYLGIDAAAVATNGTDGTEYLGRFTETELVLLDGILSGNQTYYWRVDMVAFGNTIVQGDVWNFDTTSIAIDPYRIEVSAVAAAYTQQVEIAIQNSVGTPVVWTADCTNEWVQLGAPGGTGSATLDIGIDLSGLEPGIHFAEVVFDDGGHQLIVPIELTVETMHLVKMETDWTLPYVYMVHASATYPHPSLLIWYNTDTETIEQVLDAGDGASDLAVHYGENRIYVNNSGNADIRVFDRSAMDELAPLVTITHPQGLSAGPPGTLIMVGGNSYYLDAYLIDTETGAQLATYPSYNGRGASTLDGRSYYHSEKGTSGADIIKFAVLPGTTDPLDYIDQVRTKDSYGSDQILVGMDGQHVYTGGAIYDADLNELLDLNDTIYAASAFGDLLVSETKAYDGTTGNEVYSLPLSASVMAFSADQSKLLLFDEGSASITNIDTAAIMVLPIPVLAPEPVDGSSCSPALQELSWSMGPGALAPGALFYDVYLGTESNTVANADTNGAVYLGRSDSPERSLLEGRLSGGQTYYWRVDMVRRSGEVVRGAVWNFETISLAVEPQELFAKGLMAADVGPLSVSISNMVEAAVGWTVSSPDEWIILTQTNGVGSGVLLFDVNLSILAPGTHIGRLVFADENGSFGVPVTVEVEALNTITKMATDWELPYIYMLERNMEWPYESRLIWYNTQTERIVQVLDAGGDVSDLTVHYGDNRVYASSRGDEEVRVFDRITREELEPLSLGGNINVITAGKPGRLLLSRNSYGSPEVWDTGTGLQVTNRIDYVYGGDVECSLDGRYCYHVSTSSDAYLSKYFIEGDTYTRVARGSGTGSWASVPILASMDGSRITSLTRIYDADLKTLAALDVSSSYESIFAISAYGELVVSGIGVHNGDTGETLYALPFKAAGMAFSGDQSSLLVFNPDNGSLTNITTSSIMLLPEPGMRPVATVGSVQDVAVRELSWSASPLALGYDVFFGVDSNAVAVATTNSSEYIGSSLSESIMVPAERLTGNETYYWRVEARSYRNQVTRSAVWNFQTASISVAPQRLLVDGVVASYTQRVDVAIGSTVGTPVDWVASCTNAWVILGTTSGTTGESLDIGFDLSGLAAGRHTAEIEFHAAGKILRLPVELTVAELNIVKMTADWELPYIYMLHRSDTISRQSLLIWYNTDLGSIEHVVDSGTYALDFTVHYGEEKIYVGNYDRDIARVFGRISREELDPFLLEQGVQSICAGAPGRILTDRGGALRIWDTSNGTNLAFIGTSDGDGECSPDGRYYYHSQDNISYGKLQKYDVSGDTFELMTNVTMSSWRSWNNLVSKDGLRVTKGRVVYDADLNEILRLTDETYSASPHADAVVTEAAIYDVGSGNQLLALPFSTKVSAFSADQTSLVMYNSTGHSISVLDTSGVLPPLGSGQPESVSAYMAWQLEYSLDVAMAAEADDDLDGQSNLAEYIAGTDPTEQDSCFVVHGAVPLPDGRVILHWDSVTGRVYHVYWTPSLGTDFQPLEPPVYYPENSYTDQVERVEQSGFYKVGVEFK